MAESDFGGGPDIGGWFGAELVSVGFEGFGVPVVEFFTFVRAAFGWFMGDGFAQDLVAESLEVARGVEHVEVPDLVDFVAGGAWVPGGDAEVDELFVFFDCVAGEVDCPAVFAGESFLEWEGDVWFVDLIGENCLIKFGVC